MERIYVCEYVHNNAIQNTYTAIFEYSYGHWELIYLSQECTRHHNIYFPSAALSDK